ncbi:hypothetical protein ACFFRM_29685, partial [Rhodococcus aetherivorans]
RGGGWGGGPAPGCRGGGAGGRYCGVGACDQACCGAGGRPSRRMICGPSGDGDDGGAGRPIGAGRRGGGICGG